MLSCNRVRERVNIKCPVLDLAGFGPVIAHIFRITKAKVCSFLHTIHNVFILYRGLQQSHCTHELFQILTVCPLIRSLLPLIAFGFTFAPAASQTPQGNRSWEISQFNLPPAH